MIAPANAHPEHRRPRHNRPTITAASSGRSAWSRHSAVCCSATTGWSSAERTSSMKNSSHLTSSSQRGWAKGCALVGCLLGALLSGGLSDRLGRKRLLWFAALLFTISSIGTGLANQFNVFVVWRIMGGTAIGLASNLSPMYIAELAPAHIRGRLVAINQLTIVIGILLAQIVELAHCPARSGRCHSAGDPRIVERPDRLALDVWRDGCAVAAVPGGDALCAGESALAGEEWPA